MEKLMNSISNKIDEMFDEFESSELCQNYLSAKKQLLNNDEVMGLIEEIKRLQKIATNNHDENIEAILKSLYQKLESYPLYQSYKVLEEEINEELFMVKEQFEKYFNSLLKLDV